MSTSTDTHPTIFPTLRYRDAEAALEWLKHAFGFTEHAVHRDDGLVDPSGEPKGSPVGLYVVVADPDAHHARAVAAGAEIIRDVEDKPWGSRDYGVRDLDGNRWWFGTYSPYAVQPEPATA